MEASEVRRLQRIPCRQVLQEIFDGKFIELKNGIRLIAVNDHFDSTRKEDMESMALPIRNMVNTMYAKDISKKVWSSLQRKKEAGYAVGSDAPFGYIRNPVTKRNEIDPETAFYVQLIFQWALMGVAIYEIARRMTLLQVPTPREWHRKIVEGKDVVTYKKWGETSIRHMDILSAGQCAVRNGSAFIPDEAVAGDGSTSNADRRICDFYDSAGGWQRGCVFGTGGSNDSASMVHIRR